LPASPPLTISKGACPGRERGEGGIDGERRYGFADHPRQVLLGGAMLIYNDHSKVGKVLQKE
jgi:hypothetical protein